MDMHRFYLCAAVLVLILGTVLPVRAQTVTKGDLVISEIMYAPASADAESEYVEVYNTTSRSIDIDNMELIAKDPEGGGEQSGSISSETEVGPGDFAVLCVDDVKSRNGGVECAIDYADDVNLTNTSQTVLLQRSDGTEVDRVKYDEAQNWPEAKNASIEFVGGENEDNAKHQHWKVANERAGDFATTTGSSSQGSPNANAPDGKLPVELTRFQVVADADQAVLEWATASETGNAGFAIQHRSPEAAEWSRLGFVEGAGTTDRRQTYDFRTESLAPGTHVFRLRQVDVDGAVHVHPTRRVQVTSGPTVQIEGPNPVRGGEPITVVFGASAGTITDVALYNVLGERVRTVTSRDASGQQGPRRRRVAVEGLSSGTYFLRARTASGETVRRITVLR